MLRGELPPEVSEYLDLATRCGWGTREGLAPIVKPRLTPHNRVCDCVDCLGRVGRPL